ncbi:type VII secretion protein EssB/YukC [Staphylospora marina]|uniref:type VII secretion protein EssB/YukC n=1 Tax=Staphylospora marina TaxID=2490858 RepID=UPI000F5C172C|nr:type VII secretion protein EssB/YukC [Staphylospora marina]
MKRIPMGDGTLTIDGDQIFYRIPAKDCNVTREELIEIEDLPGIGFRAKARFTEDESQLELHFVPEEKFVPFDRIRNDWFQDVSVRLTISRNLLLIADYFMHRPQWVTLFHPMNFFVHEQDGTVLVLYRGLKGQMPAPGYEEESLAEQVKRLILLLFTSSKYEELLLNGNSYAARRLIEAYRPLVRKLLKARELEELQQVMDEAIEEHAREMEQKEEASQAAGASEKKPIPWLPVAGGVVGLLALMAVLWMDPESAPPEESALPREYVDSLRAMAIRDTRWLTRSLEQLDDQELKSLSPDDRQSALELLVFIGDIDRVNKVDPEFMANFARKEQKIKELRFEKAVYQKDNGLITELWNQIYLTPRRYKIAVEAFAHLGKYEEAKKTAEQSKDHRLVEWVQKQQSQQQSGGQQKANPSTPQQTSTQKNS